MWLWLCATIALASLSAEIDAQALQCEHTAFVEGGIQWYRSVTTYDRDGNVIGFREDGHDMHERTRAIEHDG